MPAYSKALSDELNKLFDTVEKQTLDYAQAFAYLKHRVEDFDSKIKDLDNYRDYFAGNFTNLAAETRININNSLGELKEKLDQVLQLYEQYAQIADYKDSLVIMYNRLKMMIEQNDFNFKGLLNKSEYTFNNFLNKSKNKLQREIEVVYSKSENKLDTKMKFFETQLIKLENKQLAEEEKTKREINIARAEISSMMNLFNSIKKSPFENSNGNIINDRFQDFTDKITDIENEFSKLKDEIEQIEINQKEINSLKTKINNIINDQEGNRKKAGSGVGISITALILAIIALIIAFAK